MPYANTADVKKYPKNAQYLILILELPERLFSTRFLPEGIYPNIGLYQRNNWANMPICNRIIER